MAKRDKLFLPQTHPHLLEEWDFDKNSVLGLDPEKLTYGSGKKAAWVCKMCGHRWEAFIHNRACKHTGCSLCFTPGRPVSDKNRFSLLYPEVAKEWHPILNGELASEDVSFGSNKEVWWGCLVCDHLWQATVGDRVCHNKGCPSCSGNIVSDKNRLSLLFPEVAKEWHTTENGDLAPYTVSFGSTRKIWWVCSKGHVWEATINSRTNMGSGCPRCVNKPVSKISQEWLDSISNSNILREFLVKELGYRVDGFDPITNTVYEFLGDLWHGNPKIFSAGEINPINKKSFGELYQNTMERLGKLRDLGYNVVYIWENDYRKEIK